MTKQSEELWNIVSMYRSASVVGKLDRRSIDVTLRWMWESSLNFEWCMRGMMKKFGWNQTIYGNCTGSCRAPYAKYRSNFVISGDLLEMFKRTTNTTDLPYPFTHDVDEAVFRTLCKVTWETLVEPNSVEKLFKGKEKAKRLLNKRFSMFGYAQEKEVREFVCNICLLLGTDSRKKLFGNQGSLEISRWNTKTTFITTLSSQLKATWSVAADIVKKCKEITVCATQNSMKNTPFTCISVTHILFPWETF